MPSYRTRRGGRSAWSPQTVCRCCSRASPAARWRRSTPAGAGSLRAGGGPGAGGGGGGGGGVGGGPCARGEAALFHSSRREGPGAGRLVHFIAVPDAGVAL